MLWIQNKTSHGLHYIAHCILVQFLSHSIHFKKYEMIFSQKVLSVHMSVCQSQPVPPIPQKSHQNRKFQKLNCHLCFKYVESHNITLLQCFASQSGDTCNQFQNHTHERIVWRGEAELRMPQIGCIRQAGCDFLVSHISSGGVR